MTSFLIVGFQLGLLIYKNNYYKLNKYVNIKNPFNQVCTETFCKYNG